MALTDNNQVFVYGYMDGEFYLYKGKIGFYRDYYEGANPIHYTKYQQDRISKRCQKARFKGTRGEDRDIHLHVFDVGENEGEVYGNFVWLNEESFENAKEAFILSEYDKIEKLKQEIKMREERIQVIRNASEAELKR